MPQMSKRSSFPWDPPGSPWPSPNAFSSATCHLSLPELVAASSGCNFHFFCCGEEKYRKNLELRNWTAHIRTVWEWYVVGMPLISVCKFDWKSHLYRETSEGERAFWWCFQHKLFRIERNRFDVSRCPSVVKETSNCRKAHTSALCIY